MVTLVGPVAAATAASEAANASTGPGAIEAVRQQQVSNAPPAAEPTAPQPIRIGSYLMALGDFDPAKKSFSASLWVWMVGPAQATASLNALEWPNAIKVETANAFNEQTPRGVWAQRKVIGSFRHGWDLRRFPFDRQLLRIDMEESDQDARHVTYVADRLNSGVDPDVKLSGWTIRSAQVVTSEKGYHTTFGDPQLTPGTASAFARAELQVLLERTDRSGFWKLTAGAFAAALMALASYGLRADQPTALSPRFALLAGSAFAVVISLRSAAAELGASSYITLCDAVHGLILMYIVVATVAGVLTWRTFLNHGDVARMKRLETRIAGFSSLALGIAILSLVFGAMAGEPL